MPRNMTELQRAVDILAKKCELAGGKPKKQGTYVSCKLGDVVVEYDANESRLVISSSKGYVDMFLDPLDVSNVNLTKLTE